MWNDLSGASPGDPPTTYNGKQVQHTRITTDYGMYDLTLGYNTETDKFDQVLNSEIVDLHFASDTISSSTQSFAGVVPIAEWLSATLTVEAAASTLATAAPIIVPIAIAVIVAYVVSKLLEEFLPPTTVPTEEGEDETVTRNPDGSARQVRNPGNERYPGQGR